MYYVVEREGDRLIVHAEELQRGDTILCKGTFWQCQEYAAHASWQLWYGMRSNMHVDPFFSCL